MVAQLGHGAFLGSYVCARLHDLAPSIVASDDSAAANVVACVHSQFRLRSEELRQVRAMPCLRSLCSQGAAVAGGPLLRLRLRRPLAVHFRSSH